MNKKLIISALVVIIVIGAGAFVASYLFSKKEVVVPEIEGLTEEQRQALIKRLTSTAPPSAPGEAPSSISPADYRRLESQMSASGGSSLTGKDREQLLKQMSAK